MGMFWKSGQVVFQFRPWLRVCRRLDQPAATYTFMFTFPVQVARAEEPLMLRREIANS